MIYLDNSATTRQHDQVTEIMLKYMREDFGNPSSLYSLGITAEKAIKEARKQMMKAMDRQQGEFYFTSGGTEADSMAIFGAANARKRRGNRIITSQVEHPAVLEACRRLEEQGFEVVYVVNIPVGISKDIPMQQTNSCVHRIAVCSNLPCMNFNFIIILLVE